MALVMACHALASDNMEKLDTEEKSNNVHVYTNDTLISCMLILMASTTQDSNFFSSLCRGSSMNMTLGDFVLLAVSGSESSSHPSLNKLHLRKNKLKIIWVNSNIKYECQNVPYSDLLKTTYKLIQTSIASPPDNTQVDFKDLFECEKMCWDMLIGNGNATQITETMPLICIEPNAWESIERYSSKFMGPLDEFEMKLKKAAKISETAQGEGTPAQAFSNPYSENEKGIITYDTTTLSKLSPKQKLQVEGWRIPMLKYIKSDFNVFIKLKDAEMVEFLEAILVNLHNIQMYPYHIQQEGLDRRMRSAYGREVDKAVIQVYNMKESENEFTCSMMEGVATCSVTLNKICSAPIIQATDSESARKKEEQKEAIASQMFEKQRLKPPCFALGALARVGTPTIMTMDELTSFLNTPSGSQYVHACAQYPVLQFPDIGSLFIMLWGQKPLLV